MALNYIYQNPTHPFFFPNQTSKKQIKKLNSLGMSVVTDGVQAKADEVYYGDKICQEKTKKWLKDMGLPNGLLPMRDMEECGIVRETGYVWLKQKKSCTHKFEEIGKLVTYAKEVTAYVDKKRIKKLTGAKAKELLIWLSIGEIYVDDPPTGKITFESPTGLSRTFPVSAFEVEGLKNVEEKKKSNKEVVNAAATVIQMKQV